MMPSLDLPPAFVNNVNLALSAGALNQLIAAAEALDGWSYRTLAATPASASADTEAYNFHSLSDFRLWWGDLRYRAGMTTLTITGYAASWTIGSTITVYLNGSGTAAATITPSSSWSGTIDISSGYSDGEIIAIDVRTSGNTTRTSEYLVRDVYGSPIVVASSWPSMPTFAGVYDSGRLNALINACSYLYDRINAVPIIPTLGSFWAHGTSKIQTYVQWAGSVLRAYTQDQLRIIGTADIFNDAEYFEVLLNGSVIHTSATMAMLAYGQPFSTTFSLPLSLASVSVGSRADVIIRSVVTDDGRLPGQPILNSRYSFLVIRAEAAFGGYPVYSPPADLAQASISATNLNTRLNALSTMLSDIKSRMDATSVMWNRARAVRRRFAQDTIQNNRKTYVHTPIFVRQGDTLIVKGKNVSVGWGARIVEPKENPWSDYVYKYDKTQSVITGDQVDTQIVPLDTFGGLYQGQFYAVTGEELHYAAEYLS
jgi:hypothetical protein